jgi:hypothetical protein
MSLQFACLVEPRFFFVKEGKVFAPDIATVLTPETRVYEQKSSTPKNSRALTEKSGYVEMMHSVEREYAIKMIRGQWEMSFYRSHSFEMLNVMLPKMASDLLQH